MLVERVETVPYALRFREPYVTARGTLERREMILLRLQTDDGPEGLGEAVPLSLRGGAGLADVHEALREAGDRLVGLDLNPGTEDPLAVAVATFLELVRPRKLPPPAAAALECALFDLAAKERDEPLWATLQAESARAGGDQRHAHRRLHDGARSAGQGLGRGRLSHLQAEARRRR